MSIETMKRWLECAERCESLDGNYSWADVVCTIKEAIEQAQKQAQLEDAPRGLIDIKRIFTSEEQKTATYVTHDELANYMDKIADAIAYNSHEQLNHLASKLRENT